MGQFFRHAFLLAAACAAASSFAQTARTWTGPEWGDFATAANWGGTAPASSLTTHYALFTGGNLNQVALSASRSIAGLEFSATATSGSISYTNTPVLTLGAYGIKNLASDSYTMQMDVGLALGANTTFTNQGDLWISGALNLGTRVLTLSGGSAWWGRLNGPISGTGSVVINHAGTGGWILNGNNTYSGGTTLTAGRLLLSSSGTGLGTGALTLNGGDLWAEYEGTVGNAITVAANSTLNGNNYATTHFTGAVTLTGARTLTVTGNGRVVFDGAVGQSAAGYALTKAGVGALVLNAASTYTGATTITGGTLALGTGGTISAANLTLNGGVLATAGTFSRTLGTGAGQLQFGSSGGGFAAYGGALTVSLTAGTDWFNLFNSQWAYFGSSVSDNVVTFTNNLALNSGDYFLDVADNTATTADRTVFTGTLSGSGNLTKQGAGQLDLTTASTRTGSTYVLGGGIVRVTEATALGAGLVTIQSSTLQLAADTATDFGNNLSATSGTNTVSSDRLTAGEGLKHQLGNLSLSGTLVVQKGANATSGTATVAFDDVTGSGSFSVVSGARVELGSFSGSSSLTFTGAGDAEILGAFTTGAGSLTKSGTGTLTLNATSSRTGVTSFSAGTLVVGADNALGTGSLTVSNVSTTLRGTNGTRTLANNVTFSTGSTLGGTSDLTFTGTVTNANNNTLTVANTGTTTFSGAFNLSNSVTNRTLTLNNSGALVFSGVIANGSTSTAGALVKNGLGTLTLAGVNTYAGNTSINAGTLNLTGSIASSALTNIAAGATLTGAGSLGDLMLAGTYAPGNSAALVAVGDFTLGSTGLLQMEIGGLLRGTGYDAFDINGTFATGGTLDVAFINGFSPAGAATFNLFDFTSLAGTFGAVNLPTLSSGYTWDSSGLYSNGELKIIASAIPEPSTYAVFAGLGALGLAWWRRRQARTAPQA
jgi:fibronectin-binding autotransporter adhesin